MEDFYWCRSERSEMFSAGCAGAVGSQHLSLKTKPDKDIESKVTWWRNL